MEAILQILRITALLCIVIITPASVHEHTDAARSIMQNSTLG
jgi:hypothetical protein